MVSENTLGGFSRDFQGQLRQLDIQEGNLSFKEKVTYTRILHQHDRVITYHNDDKCEYPIKDSSQIFKYSLYIS